MARSVWSADHPTNKKDDSGLGVRRSRQGEAECGDIMNRAARVGLQAYGFDQLGLEIGLGRRLLIRRKGLALASADAARPHRRKPLRI